MTYNVFSGTLNPTHYYPDFSSHCHIRVRLGMATVKKLLRCCTLQVDMSELLTGVH